MRKEIILTTLLIFLIQGFQLPQAQAAAISDEELLDLIEKRAFHYFWNEANPEIGLVRDKAYNFRGGGDPVASVASVGFALTAYPIGIRRRWVSYDEAYDRTLRTLRFFLNEAEHVHGFFYHFLDMQDGKRAWNSELSSIDTALFLAGALFAASYFKGTEVERLADQIYRRVDFPWMMNQGPTLSMGWKPETGFLKHRWKDYNENMILYFLAIGSPAYPISPDVWKQIRRKVMAYGDHVLIASPPLFTHQYSHCWIDFRGVTDGFANYFENSRQATLANRDFCLAHQSEYKTYSENIWGLTASDGPKGYLAYGSEPGGAKHDGTVAPTAALSSIVFTPELSKKVARELYEKHRQKLWGRFGFCDAFNLDPDWRSSYVLGIDQGPILIMFENHRSEFVWKYFMKVPAIQGAMKKIGFHPGQQALKLPEIPTARARKRKSAVTIDGNMSDWAKRPKTLLDPDRFLEYGEADDAKDLQGEFALQWDEQFLYFYCRVQDEQLVVIRRSKEMHRDDLVELFIDPAGDGFRWKDRKDFQFGMTFKPAKQKTECWLWPHDYNVLAKGDVFCEARRLVDGYELEMAIPWSLLGLRPEEGTVLRLTPAVHDRDGNGSEGKITWYFSGSKDEAFDLGKVVLAA